jgi:hypothetical protein
MRDAAGDGCVDKVGSGCMPLPLDLRVEPPFEAAWIRSGAGTLRVAWGKAGRLPWPPLSLSKLRKAFTFRG